MNWKFLSRKRFYVCIVKRWLYDGVCLSEPTGGATWECEGGEAAGGSGGGLVREFGACGGLALVAARLPRPRAAPPDPPAPAPAHDLDWVKLDDPYEVLHTNTLLF